MAACYGSSYTLSVTATGSNLKYQWRKNGANINKAINSEYLISSISQSDVGSYDVLLSGTCGLSATSTMATFGMEIAVMHFIGPSPAPTEFAVEISLHTDSDFTIRLVDLRGAVVWSMHETLHPAGQSILYIPVFMLSSGVYGIEAVIGGQSLRSAINVTY